MKKICLAEWSKIIHNPIESGIEEFENSINWTNIDQDIIDGEEIS